MRTLELVVPQGEEQVRRDFKYVDQQTAAPLSALLMQVVFPMLSPVLDAVTMDFAYLNGGGPAPTQQDVIDLTNKWVSAWTAIPSGASFAPSKYLSPVVSTVANGGTIKVYDISAHLNGTPHGSPIYTRGWTPTVNSGQLSGIPEGVCCVVTLQAPYGTDVEFAPGARPRARDRGRLYFGPLHAAALAQESGTNRSTIMSSAATDLMKWVHAISTLVSTAGVIWDLGVWSRINAIVKQIIELWVDDRPDYQRRRADQSTVRYFQPVP